MVRTVWRKEMAGDVIYYAQQARDIIEVLRKHFGSDLQKILSDALIEHWKMFYDSSHTIAKLCLNNMDNYTQMFTYCEMLKKITVPGSFHTREDLSIFKHFTFDFIGDEDLQWKIKDMFERWKDMESQFLAPLKNSSIRKVLLRKTLKEETKLPDDVQRKIMETYSGKKEEMTGKLSQLRY